MLSKYHLFVLLLSFIPFTSLFAQNDFIHTKEGYNILRKRELISDCLDALHKDRSDATALSVCECQIRKLDWHFTKKQYKQFTTGSNGGMIDISGLIETDSTLKNEIQQCFTNSGKTMLLQAEGFEDEFIAKCKKEIRESTERKLDDNRLNTFCRCQLNMAKTKKLTDADMQTLSNPNSLLFYETIYTCGEPFAVEDSIDNKWSEAAVKDINGPQADTIKVLNLHGMTYLKMKTGSMVQFWLFDTGSSDLLINKDMETILKEEGIIKPENYIGTGQYEMANGMIDTCRKYTINGVRVGKFTLNNVMVAVTDKGKKIIVGRSLLNKFTNWVIDNKNNTLVLAK
jgi:hypothetical protein